MIAQLWDVSRDIHNDNTDEQLFEMIDFRILEMKNRGLNPGKIELTISCRDEIWKHIWLMIQDDNSQKMGQQESIWINLYDYSCNTIADETPLAKKEAYRLKRLLKRHYSDLMISSDLRGC